VIQLTHYNARLTHTQHPTLQISHNICRMLVTLHFFSSSELGAETVLRWRREREVGMVMRG
jgi:hypothetical protein